MKTWGGATFFRRQLDSLPRRDTVDQFANLDRVFLAAFIAFFSFQYFIYGRFVGEARSEGSSVRNLRPSWIIP